MNLGCETRWEAFEVREGTDRGVVRVLRNERTPDRAELWRRLRHDEMTQPFIFETAFERRLHFNWDSTQSAMLLNDPCALVAAYTRKMMAFLLFNPTPRRILMIGLGGGSLAKFCHRRFPEADITAVDIDPDVIALRDEFLVPRDDSRFRVICADGAGIMGSAPGDAYDAILIDAFDAQGIAASLSGSSFYRLASQRLAPNGSLVMNLWGRIDRYADNLREAARAFGKSVRLVPMLGGNTLMFAFTLERPLPRKDELVPEAQRLQRTLGLDFPRFLQRIKNGYPLIGGSVPART